MDMVTTFIGLIPVTLVQSLIYAFVALAVMIPFRILNFPDLSSEGTFPLGGCVCGALLAMGYGPVAAMAAGVAGGFVAGSAVAMIALRFRISSLLSGIIVITMLYSVNLRVMGRSNIALFTYPTIFDLVHEGLNQSLPAKIALLGAVVALVLGLLFAFLKTEKGIALRAVGANLDMAQAQGISVWWTTVAGVGLAASFSAFAGAVLVQSQGFSDVNIGFGVVINGLASLIIGELLVGRQNVARQLLAPVIGAIAYYQLVSVCLALGLAPSDLKFASGLLVLAMLAAPMLFGKERMMAREKVE
ncbi:MAG: ABC transporter permease [Hyphomicrobiales bacterium]|nr:ABC transporter permease [Hyphomicrobiales bacterium]